MVMELEPLDAPGLLAVLAVRSWATDNISVLEKVAETPIIC